jgi:hypothetical protein
MNEDLNLTLWMQTLMVKNRSTLMKQDKLKTLAQVRMFKCHKICRKKCAIQNLTSDISYPKKGKRKERLEKETLEI